MVHVRLDCCNGEGENLDASMVNSTLSPYDNRTWIYKVMKEKLPNNLHSLFSFLERDCFLQTDNDEHDQTIKSCILLVAIIVMLIIKKRPSGSLS